MPGPIDIAYVRVMPDLSRFEKEAKADIKAALKPIGEEADKAAKAAERAMAQAEKEIAANLRKVEREAERAFQATAREAEKAARAAEREFQRTEKESARASAQMAKDAQRAQEKIEHDAQKAADAQVRAAQKAERDSAVAYERLAKEHEREAQKIARDAEREALRVSKAHEKAAKDAEKSFARFAKEAEKQQIKLKISVEKDNKALAKTRKDVIDFFKDFLVTGLKGVGAAAGVALIGGIVPAAVNLVAALAPVAGALAGALPGAIAIAAASIGTLVLGFQGIGDALKNINDVDKFNEALKSLAPNAQAFAIALRDVLPQLKGIQQAVQNNLFAGFDVQLKAIVANLAGPLKTGLSDIATEFNHLGQEAGKFFQSQAAVDGLNAILRSTRDILHEFGPAIQPLLNGFSALAVAAQPFISALSGGLADVAKRFGDFLTQAASSGSLNDFFSSALATLGDLGLILRDVGSILKSVFTAGSADGGSLLSRFQELTRSVADFLSSAEGKEALTALFTALATASTAVMDVVRPLLPLVGQMVSLLGAELVGALKALAAIIVPIVTAFADGLKPLFPQLIQAAKDLTPSLVKLGEALGKHFAEQIKELMPSLVELIHVFVENMVPILIQLIPLAIQLIPVFTAMALVFAKVATVLIKLSSINLGMILGAVKAIADIDWSGVWKSISGAFDKAWEAVKKFFSDVGTSVADFFKGIGKWFSNGFTKAQDETTGFFSKIGTFFSELPGKIGAWLSTLPGKLVDALNSAFDAATRAIGQAIGIILFGILEFPKQIPGILSSLGNIIRDFFVGIWDNVWTWTVNGWNKIIGFIVTVPGLVYDGVVSLLEKMGTFFVGLWTNVWTWTTNGWNVILTFIQGLPDQILSGVLSLGTILGNFFTGLWNNVRTWTVNGWNSIIDFIKSVPGKIGDLVGFFSNAGKKLIDGFISGFKNVGNFIGDVAGSIVGGIKSFINRVIGNLNSGIADIDSKLPGDLPRIPYLASGGITTGPTPAFIGERGAEAVVPLTGVRGRKAMAMLGGGDGGQSVTFESGAIAISFEGVTPSKAEATQTGEAVGAGILSALMRRDVRLEMRMV